MRTNEQKIDLKKIISNQIKVTKQQKLPKELSLVHRFVASLRQVAPIEWVPEHYQSQIKALDAEETTPGCFRA